MTASLEMPVKLLPYIFVDVAPGGQTPFAEEYQRNCIKVVVMGDFACGKSSILLRIARNQFDEHSRSTVQVDFVSKNIVLKDTNVRLKMNFFDLVGQDIRRPHNGMMALFQHADAAIGVFDATRPLSFD